MTSRALDAGLARERTSLAWNRTALALLVNGLLVSIRHEDAFPLPVALTLASLALVVAALAAALAVVRSRVVRQEGPEVLPARALVISLGVGVTVLCLATSLTVVRWG